MESLPGRDARGSRGTRSARRGLVFYTDLVGAQINTSGGRCDEVDVQAFWVPYSPTEPAIMRHPASVHCYVDVIDGPVEQNQMGDVRDDEEAVGSQPSPFAWGPYGDNRFAVRHSNSAGTDIGDDLGPSGQLT